MPTKRNKLMGVDELLEGANSIAASGNTVQGTAVKRKEASSIEASQHEAPQQVTEKRTIYLSEELAERVDDIQYKLRKKKVKVSFSQILITAIERGWESDEEMIDAIVR